MKSGDFRWLQGPVFVLLALLLAPPVGAVPPAPWEADELIGKPAPEFRLAGLDGKRTGLSDLKGKVVLLNFFASWCPPCKAEMPSMNALQKRFRDKGLEVVAVSSDRTGDALRRFLARVPVSFTVLHDPENELAHRYKVYALPTSYIIDRDGTLAKKIFGGYDWVSEESISMFSEFLGR